MKALTNINDTVTIQYRARLRRAKTGSSSKTVRKVAVDSSFIKRKGKGGDRWSP